MSYLTQKTIKNDVSFSGIALHSGKDVNICIKPSKPNSGIVFKRVDLKTNNFVYPSFSNVTNTSLNTTIENEFGVKVSTIEHLMGALFGLGIDNVLIEIDNEEVPILDGSAKNFIEKIISVGFEASDDPIINVMDIVLSTFIPINAVIVLSCSHARWARPKAVLVINNVKIAIKTMVTKTIKIWR